jgi:shikimate kinase
VNNIILVGFMGSGKTAVAKALSEKLKWHFEDIDALIVKNAAMPINKIFAEFGEARFRELETQAAVETCSQHGQVISTGGGIVTIPRNIPVLKKSGTVIYLKNTFATSRRRIGAADDRPLFRQDKIKEARALFNKRLPMYKKAADITIVTDKKNVGQVVESIVKKLGVKIEEN